MKQCTKDCGPRKLTRNRMCMWVFAQPNQPNQFFYDRAIIIFLTCEESGQPTIHANKIFISIFLTVKATILDTHGCRFNLNCY